MKKLLGWLLITLCFQRLVARRVRSTSTSPVARSDLRINNCEGTQISFDHNGEILQWPIFVNEYCNEKITMYSVTGAPDELANGIYELYGRSGNANRWERVTANGTTFTLRRTDISALGDLASTIESDFTWVITRGERVVFVLLSVVSGRYSNIGGKKLPSGEMQWLPVGTSKPITLTLHKHVLNKKPLSRLSLDLVDYADAEDGGDVAQMSPDLKVSDACVVNSEGHCDNTLINADSKGSKPKRQKRFPIKSKATKPSDSGPVLTPSSRPSATRHLEDDPNLLDMLHPGVGPSLGRKLRSLYEEASPIPSITLDNVFDSKLLHEALTFRNIPLSQWVGPEEAAHCCKGKYRLNFDKWRTNQYAIALQSLLHSPTFIGFLEQMTGISGLEPMLIDDNRILWAGSSLIAVERGGFLNVHNDFNTQSDLYRRINVLLYLNEHWKDSWQGHLELWDTNATTCAHRILPKFNRMSIFTVLDDAFHGHPEPSAAPRDDIRYALQIVYYTKEFPRPYVSRGTFERMKAGLPTRTYPPLHGAVFQASCVEPSAYQESSSDLSYICGKEFAAKNNNQPLCECNYRTVY